MNKKIILSVILLTISISIFLIVKNRNKSNVDDASINNIDINLEENELVVDYDNIDASDINLTNTSVNITKSGTYNLKGTITDGQIIINTTDTEDVILILDNVSITCQNSSPILVKKASKVIINLKEGSTNTLIDGTNYSVNEDEEPNGTIFSKSDLVINGSGILNITSNYEDAIVSKDGLKILGGIINIIAKDDGIRGKDYVLIENSNIKIDAKGNGIKSTNDNDTSLGYIVLDNSTINIKSTLDGIQAETSLQIDGGVYNIETGGGSSITSTDNSWGKWKNTKVTESAKALKSGISILINNGTFTINSSDDAIHSNSKIEINNGTFDISSGDDGIHSDSTLVINNGVINITKSYEGIESSIITINSGNINVVSSDDGFNVAGGNDGSSQNRPGANSYSNNTSNCLNINGGNIIVNASGDGLDSNGSISMKGGNVIVYGPTDNGNGALDYDGIFNIDGGTLIAAGSSGMAMNVSSSSSQNSVIINFSTIYPSNSTLQIKTGNTTIIDFKAIKQYQNIVISSDKLEKNNTYSIYINDSLNQTFTINSILTSVGNSYGMGGGPQRR